MTEKLKYKVGDKVLIGVEVTERYKGIGDLRDQIEGFDIKMSSKTIMPKPKLPQEVMDWYEEHENEWADWDIRDWLSATQEYDFVDEWISANNVINLDRQHALATLIAYGPQAVEVEKVKKYRVKLKATEQYLKKSDKRIIFSGIVAYAEVSYYKCFKFTKQELIDAGFEGVFDNPMFEVEEVE